MSVLPFEMKHARLLDDQYRGYVALHMDARRILNFVCAYCSDKKGWKPPVVTQFGRTRQEMENIYTQTYTVKGLGVDAAKKKARDRFSWHCIDAISGWCRAFDVRTKGRYSPDQADSIMFATKVMFPGAEVLHHVTAGSAEHLHFAAPDPAGKPKDWI